MPLFLKRECDRTLGAGSHGAPALSLAAHADRPDPPGRLSDLSVFHSESGSYGGFVWARRALNSRKTPVSGPGRPYLGLRLLRLGKELRDDCFGPSVDRARSHCRFVLRFIRFIPDSLTRIGASIYETTMRPNCRRGAAGGAAARRLADGALPCGGADLSSQGDSSGRLKGDIPSDGLANHLEPVAVCDAWFIMHSNETKTRQIACVYSWTA